MWIDGVDECTVCWLPLHVAGPHPAAGAPGTPPLALPPPRGVKGVILMGGFGLVEVS